MTRSALSSSRHEHENALLEKRVESFLNQDKIDSFDKLVAKLRTEIKPEGFLFYQTDTGLNLLHFSTEQPPQVVLTILININLEVVIYKKQHIVLPFLYSHILSFNKISKLSEITNLMPFTKFWKISPQIF